MMNLIEENALVEVQNNQVVVSSLQIAEHFGKNHKDVLRDIRTEIGYAQNCADPSEAEMFCETTYIHPQNGQEYPMFLMNRDGFTLLAMGFTGKEASDWKRKYIRAFNQMEEMLKKQAQESVPSYQIVDEIERAKRWIEEAQERKQLAETNQKLKEELNEEKEFKNTVYEFGKNVCYRDAYKIVSEYLNHIGERKFFDILIEKKIISKLTKLPNSKFINNGTFEVKKTFRNGADRIQGVVTPKGINWLIKYFKKLFPQNQ